MANIFATSEITSIKPRLKHEAENFAFNPKRWVKSQRDSFSQFGGETRKDPDQGILKGLGYLVWGCSLFEQKVSRAVFWLECYKANNIVELPGQGIRLQINLDKLNRLLNDSDITAILGTNGVDFILVAIKKIYLSIKFRDDVLHGHHMGAWGEGEVFRVRGKSFSKDQTDFVKLTAKECRMHGDVVLSSTTILALIDHYFDTAHNG